MWTEFICYVGISFQKLECGEIASRRLQNYVADIALLI